MSNKSTNWATETTITIIYCRGFITFYIEMLSGRTFIYWALNKLWKGNLTGYITKLKINYCQKELQFSDS